MVLPGIQALFGFQLIAAFNERFKELTKDEQLIHFGTTVLVTIAIVLIMTPAACHRLAEQTTISKFFVWLASWLPARPSRDYRSLHDDGDGLNHHRCAQK